MKDIVFNNLIKVAISSLTIVSVVILHSTPVSAHGKSVMQESRIYHCYSDELDTAQVIACQTQIVVSEPSGIYHRLGLAHIEASGNHQGVILDGKICSTDIERLKKLNFPRSDWMPTMLTSDLKKRLPFDYKTNISDGTSYFEFDVIKDSYDATQPIKWNDMENQPSCNIGYATFDCGMPANKTGRHLIYGIWPLGDSREDLYSCSDVVFSCSDGPDPQGIDAHFKKFHWNVGAGNTAYTGIPPHLYSLNGETLVSLTVTDNADATNLPYTKATIDSDSLSISSYSTHLPGGSIDACVGINGYPNWTQTDWSDIPNHANARDLMQHGGSAYKANWYTKAIPGSDASWSFAHTCN